MVGLTDKEMAYALGMTARNLYRLQGDQRFGVEASERRRLRNLLTHALDTFEGCWVGSAARFVNGLSRARFNS